MYIYEKWSDKEILDYEEIRFVIRQIWASRIRISLIISPYPDPDPSINKKKNYEESKFQLLLGLLNDFLSLMTDVYVPTVGKY